MTMNVLALLMLVACGNKEEDTAVEETNVEESESSEEQEMLEGSEGSEGSETNSSEDTDTSNDSGTDREGNDQNDTDTGTTPDDPSTIDADGDGVFANEDCNDNNPSQPLDENDCDGVLTVDDCNDNDGGTINDMDCDGYTNGNDCDDNDSSINPGASDTSMDGIDQDCDGTDGPPAQTITCPTDEIPDCNGNCAPSDWIGDGYCDDGFGFWSNEFIYFDCPEFNNDGGDC